MSRKKQAKKRHRAPRRDWPPDWVGGQGAERQASRQTGLAPRGSRSWWRWNPERDTHIHIHIQGTNSAGFLVPGGPCKAQLSGRGRRRWVFEGIKKKKKRRFFFGPLMTEKSSPNNQSVIINRVDRALGGWIEAR
jgi:hypothetical protein